MGALEKIAALPAWPARMTAPVAAAYMGVSQGTFLDRFGTLGVKEGTNKFWAKVQLDRIIAKQFAIPQPLARAAEDDDSWADLG